MNNPARLLSAGLLLGTCRLQRSQALFESLAHTDSPCSGSLPPFGSIVTITGPIRWSRHRREACSKLDALAKRSPA